MCCWWEWREERANKKGWVGVRVRSRSRVERERLFSPPLSHTHTRTRTHPHSLILETDPATVAARVSMAGAEGELPLGEQTLAKVAAMAKEQIARSLQK